MDRGSGDPRHRWVWHQLLSSGLELSPIDSQEGTRTGSAASSLSNLCYPVCCNSLKPDINSINIHVKNTKAVGLVLNVVFQIFKRLPGSLILFQLLKKVLT